LADIFSRKQPLFGPSDGSFFRISFSAEGKLGQDLRKISTERMPIGPEDEPACHDVVADVLGLLRDTITPPASRGIFDPPHIMTRSIMPRPRSPPGRSPGPPSSWSSINADDPRLPGRESRTRSIPDGRESREESLPSGAGIKE
jgi:hypothetical protein